MDMISMRFEGISCPCFKITLLTWEPYSLNVPFNMCFNITPGSYKVTKAASPFATLILDNVFLKNLCIQFFNAIKL